MHRIVLYLVGILCTLQLSAQTCPFCNPEVIERQVILEGHFFNVLLEYMPRINGHLLVVPKRHMAKAHELSTEEWAELGSIFPSIAKGFAELLQKEDYLVLEKNGPSAFQQIPHVHFHLFPIRSETWASIFDVPPKRLDPETFERQALLFKEYFTKRE